MIETIVILILAFWLINCLKIIPEKQRLKESFWVDFNSLNRKCGLG